VQVLFEDKQLQQTIFNKHRDELRSLNDKINEIMVSSPTAVHLACMSFLFQSYCCYIILHSQTQA